MSKKKAQENFEDKYAYKYTSKNGNEIWVSKTNKIDYKKLYEIMITSHKERAGV